MLLGTRVHLNSGVTCKSGWRLLVLLVGAVLLLPSALAYSQTSSEADLYLEEIKPLLRERCYACHGALKQESDLRLDTAASILDAGIVDTDVVEHSVLLERISAPDEHERMPPEGHPLDDLEIAAIRTWIEQGAVGPPDEQPEASPNEHWAFIPPRRHVSDWSHGDAVSQALPEVDLLHRLPNNLIDAFVLAKQSELGVSPTPLADRRVLIRRVYLDLVGLPPTPDQIQTFLDDPRADAYHHLVDRLLASPQYGERWGRHWMDVWRYSDWFGLGAQLRYSQKHIWHWRDWIVESLNDDRGYDEMIRLMLAADEIDPTNQDDLRATGFLARNYFLFNRTTWLDHTIEHTSKAFMGLTVNCAKCHDHKYDPISQVDYYRLRAIFEPHHVRLDPVPGESNLVNDGLPRTYDLHLELPTFLHIRGDASRPDTNRAIEPGIPGFLNVVAFAAEPVDLPLTAYRPDLLEFVVDSQREQTRLDLVNAESRLAESRRLLNEIVESDTDTINEFTGGEPNENGDDVEQAWLVDSFGKHDENLWQAPEGEWTFGESGARQDRTGFTRAFLRSAHVAPADFCAKLSFTTHGGDQWKSVGLAFDCHEDQNVLIYLSAVQPGSKLQVSYNTSAGSTYPSEGKIDRSVVLDQLYEMDIVVKGALVNVYLNGDFMVAYELPIARRSGHIDLVAFDASATFHSIEIRALAADESLIAAGSRPLSKEQAEWQVELLNAEVERARLYLEALNHSIECSSAEAHVGTPSADDTIRMRAAQDYANWLAADARVALIEARIALAIEPEVQAKLDAVAQAQSRLDQALAAAENPSGAILELHVTEKALEGPDETEEHRRLPYPRESTGRRRALADWLTHSKHPLTARVAVNHIWMRHFGRPIVDSVTDFGRRAPKPEFAELLDALAVELIESGWSMKHLHRIIVTSEAYQRSAAMSPLDDEGFKMDPENLTYWRRDPVRMESQLLHDAVRYLADQLDLAMGGPTVDPTQSTLPARRGIYFEHSRDAQNEFLSMFDDADILRCYRRQDSVVPQQALAMANSRLSLESSVAIAAKLENEFGDCSDDEFANLAYLYILGVPPNDVELQICVDSLQSMIQFATQSNSSDARKRARELFVHALLNCNDFITIR